MGFQVGDSVDPRLESDAALPVRRFEFLYDKKMIAYRLSKLIPYFERWLEGRLPALAMRNPQEPMGGFRAHGSNTDHRVLRRLDQPIAPRSDRPRSADLGRQVSSAATTERGGCLQVAALPL
jgi:hypothetical protein